MVKWFYKIVQADGSIAYETFRADDKLSAKAHVEKYFPNAQSYIRLTEDEYLNEIKNLQ